MKEASHKRTNTSDSSYTRDLESANASRQSRREVSRGWRRERGTLLLKEDRITVEMMKKLWKWSSDGCRHCECAKCP